ncbi:MAG: DNA mismatch repair protein MutS [Methanoregula sp.]|nr:DNA mismatch repair protein MutS [Methanoregula sp.]
MNKEPASDEKSTPDTPGKLTPAMQQYRECKARYPDAILFFHIGDFYETFEADAELVSRELDIVLTSRSKNGEHRTPLAGVPHHAVEGYIAKLVAKGYKVAVCDQLEDAKKAKGLVKRDVVRVITPGTVIDPAMLPSSAATYLMALCPAAKGGEWGAAFLDISTGEFFVTPVAADNITENIRSECSRYRPKECIIPSGIDEEILQSIRNYGVVVTLFRDEAFSPQQAEQALCSHLNVASLAGFGCDAMPAAIGAGGAALAYALETQNAPLVHVSQLATRTSAHGMLLDAVTLRNLEVSESIRGGSKGTTLFGSLDLTKTPMGSRLLLRQLTRPLTDLNEIDTRLDAVEFFVNRTTTRLSLMALLRKHADIERITARISYGNAGPRDLVALADSLSTLPDIREVLSSAETGTVPRLVTRSRDALVDLLDTIDLIRRAITDDPPPISRNGGVIRAGYSRELDELTGVLRSGKGWIVALQVQEREKTGIKSLKIGYNKIFGYYIDITKPNLPLVPAHYERRQTTATGERYTLPELREKEALITNADERVLALERDLYTHLLETLSGVIPALQQIASAIATLDVSCALAEVAQTHDYIRPVLDNGDAIIIRDGRHPVVENCLANGFVPNDTELASAGTQIMIITGANMAGKSTYMRAVALCCIMAQAGSFVPARHARIGILDRVFTRVGAFDDLASGQSTFFVEMLELANILNNVTPKSLVILDEIGRGTSTVDGCSIAKAVLEYLHSRSVAGPKTLFATHFHELIEMEGSLKRVKNYHFAVRDTNKEVVFLRKLIPGATDKSYGIHVARLAGIPKKVTERADAILTEAMNREVPSGTRPQRYTQILLVDDHVPKSPAQIPAPSPASGAVPSPVLAALARINPDEMTPLQALAKIAELKQILDKTDDKL